MPGDHGLGYSRRLGRDGHQGVALDLSGRPLTQRLPAERRPASTSDSSPPTAPLAPPRVTGSPSPRSGRSRRCDREHRHPEWRVLDRPRDRLSASTKQLPDPRLSSTSADGSRGPVRPSPSDGHRAAAHREAPRRGRAPGRRASPAAHGRREHAYAPRSPASVLLSQRSHLPTRFHVMDTQVLPAPLLLSARRSRRLDDASCFGGRAGAFRRQRKGGCVEPASRDQCLTSASARWAR